MIQNIRRIIEQKQPKKLEKSSRRPDYSRKGFNISSQETQLLKVMFSRYFLPSIEALRILE